MAKRVKGLKRRSQRTGLQIKGYSLYRTKSVGMFFLPIKYVTRYGTKKVE